MANSNAVPVQNLGPASIQRVERPEARWEGATSRGPYPDPADHVFVRTSHDLMDISGPALRLNKLALGTTIDLGQGETGQVVGIVNRVNTPTEQVRHLGAGLRTALAPGMAGIAVLGGLGGFAGVLPATCLELGTDAIKGGAVMGVAAGVALTLLMAGKMAHGTLIDSQREASAFAR